jgi:hypothetical protein
LCLPLSLAPCALCLYFVLLLLIRIGTSLLSRQNPLTNLLYWLPQQIVLVVLAMKSILYRFGRKIDWKGREI